MRTIQFLVFFSVVMTVFGLLSFYIYSRGIYFFPVGTSGRLWFKAIFIFLSLSYVIARLLERVWLSPVSDVFTWIGSFWLAAFFYFVLLVVAVDLLRLVNIVLPIIPDFVKSAAYKPYLFWGSISLVGGLLLGGYINSINPRVKTLDIVIHKNANGLKNLKAVFASDIHLGTLIGPRRTNTIVQKINAQNPDIILLGGDIVDEDLAPVIRNNLGDSLKKLKAPLGVFGITGNHEYIGGAEQAVKYLEEHGVTMIRDSVIKVNDNFYVFGREDRDSKNFAGIQRKEVSELSENFDHTLPIILLDHQPFELDKKQAMGVDLTLSGHTHHGQIWPLNYITKAIFEVSWGYKKKANMHTYVSSGVGGWGPPVRIGNRPEIVVINISFKP